MEAKRNDGNQLLALDAMIDLISDLLVRKILNETHDISEGNKEDEDFNKIQIGSL
jgi:hypothetical protein